MPKQLTDEKKSVISQSFEFISWPLQHRELDYDYQESHMYEVVVTATDMGEPPLSGSTTVQVWLDNVNNKSPVLDPPHQVVRVKEDAAEDLLIHVIQAYDPDGDGITFKFAGENFLVSLLYSLIMEYDINSLIRVSTALFGNSH